MSFRGVKMKKKRRGLFLRVKFLILIENVMKIIMDINKLFIIMVSGSLVY